MYSTNSHLELQRRADVFMHIWVIQKHMKKMDQLYKCKIYIKEEKLFIIGFLDFVLSQKGLCVKGHRNVLR